MKSGNDLANLVLFIHIRCIIPTFESEVLEIIGFENSDRSIVKTACLTKKTRFKTKEGTPKISGIFHTVSSVILLPAFSHIVSGNLQSPHPVCLSHKRGFLHLISPARE